jgi:DNA-binding XRE family transcriptional regulator
MGSLADRIQVVMSEFNLTSKEFAEKIGVQRSSISHIVSGRNKPSLDFIVKLTTTFPDLNSKWLLHGKEEMIKRDEGPVTDVNKPSQEQQKPLVTNVTDSEDQPVYESKPPAPQDHQPIRATQPTSRKEFEESQTDQTENKKPESQQPSTPARSGSKKISKIILVYSDGSFEELNPNS